MDRAGELLLGQLRAVRRIEARSCVAGAELAEQEFAARSMTGADSMEFRCPGGVWDPPMGFTAARYCDVPWGEQYEWKGFLLLPLCRFGRTSGR